MKFIGYSILIVGIFAVCVPRYPAGKKIGAMERLQLESMPQQETYSRSELLTAINNFALSVEHASGEVPIGGALVMLSGGILIDLGSRRKKKPTTATGQN